MRRHRQPRGLLITGTDTGVGKTVVACALAAWCRHRGFDVGVMKPVATGGRLLSETGERRWVSDDAVRLVRAAQATDAWSLVNPVCFKEPLAPWTAALRARRPIPVSKVLRAFRALAVRHEFLIVEGVGGLLVPLTSRVTVADVAKRFNLPLVLVARPGLGTLNHTLLSLECIRRLGLRLEGLVINHTQPPPRDAMSRVAERTNPSVLERVGRVRILGRLPFRTPPRNGHEANGTLAGWVSDHLDPQWLDGLAAETLTAQNGCGKVSTVRIAPRAKRLRQENRVWRA